jgi:hypothetical protein
VHAANGRFDQTGAVAFTATRERQKPVACVVRLKPDITESNAGVRLKPDASCSGVPTDGVAHQVSKLLIGHRSG